MTINDLEDMDKQELQMELQNGGRFIVFPYIISAVHWTWRRDSKIFFIKGNKSAILKSIPYLLLSLVLGWWSIWGIIYTPGTIFRILRGGRDITDEVLATLK